LGHLLLLLLQLLLLLLSQNLLLSCRLLLLLLLLHHLNLGSLLDVLRSHGAVGRRLLMDGLNFSLLRNFLFDLLLLRESAFLLLDLKPGVVPILTILHALLDLKGVSLVLGRLPLFELIEAGDVALKNILIFDRLTEHLLLVLRGHI